MSINNEKRYIPGTNPDWNKELPEGYDNSLVDKHGQAWDNGYNFDERSDDHVDEVNQTSYDNLGEQIPFDPISATKARQEILESGKKEEPRKMMGTKEKWDYKIPEGKWNSLVSADGTNVKNHWTDENGILADWNYDEKKDPEDIEEQ